MLNLDEYMDMAREVQIFGETLHVKQPTVRMIQRIRLLEKDITVENVLEKRIDVAELIINNNREGKIISKEQLKGLSRSALELLIAHGTGMIKEAEQDPN